MTRTLQRGHIGADAAPRAKAKEIQMNQTATYSVPGISCGHCRAAITAEVSAVPGVETVDVDVDAKLVAISGRNLEDAALVAAIDEAGYEAVRT
jgi:copper chaperone CopZ